MNKAPSFGRDHIYVNLCGNEGTNKWAAQQGGFNGVEGPQSATSYLNRAATVPPRISSLLMKTPLVHSHKRIQFQQLGQLQRNKCVCVRGVVPENTCLPVANSNNSGSCESAVAPLLKTELDTDQSPGSWLWWATPCWNSAGSVFFSVTTSLPVPVTSCGDRILWSLLTGADLARQLEDKPGFRSKSTRQNAGAHMQRKGDVG